MVIRAAPACVFGRADGPWWKRAPPAGADTPDDQFVAGGGEGPGRQGLGVPAAGAYPEARPKDNQPYQWTNESQIGKDILALSQSVTVLCVVGAAETPTTASNSGAGGPSPFVTVPEDVEGTGGYISGKPFVATLRSSPNNRR